MGFVLKNFCWGILAAEILDSATDVTLEDVTRFPTSMTIDTPLVLTISDGRQDPEIVYATSIVENVLTIQRGQEGTVPKVWPKGSKIWAMLTSAMIETYFAEQTVNADQIVFAPSGTLEATDVQTAIQELDTETQAGFAAQTAALNAAVADLDADIAAVIASLAGYQPLDPMLTALSGLTSASDQMLYFTGPDAVALSTLSAYARTLLDDADDATARGTLGLGALAILNSIATGQLDANAVTNAKLAQMAAGTLKGNNTGGLSDPLDLTAAEVKALLAIAQGDVDGLVAALAEKANLNGGNTFNGAQTLQLDAGSTALLVLSTVNSAGEGPSVYFRRAKSGGVGVASDNLCVLRWNGQDNAGADQEYGTIYCSIVDPTAGSEDGIMRLRTVVAGAMVNQLILQNGLQVGNATGGTFGAGTINATEYYKNGVVFAGGGVLQRSHNQTKTPIALAALVIPADNTTPLNTEGAELFSDSFTPLSASSTIRIEGVIEISCATASVAPTIALFRGSTCLAVWVADNASSANDQVAFAFEEASGSTSARTYSLRYGSGSSTVAINEDGGSGGNYGSNLCSTMTITEFE